MPLNGVARMPDGSFVAVGWNGEWLLGDSTARGWRTVRAPSRAVLTDVDVASNGMAVAVGEGGAL